MRFPSVLAFLLLSGSWSSSQIAQTSPAAETLVSKAVAAFSLTPVQDVHLTGRAHAIAGSTNENGTFSFDLQSTGESRLDLKLASLSRTETTGSFSGVPKCQWISADGVQHDAAQHNCLLPVHWIVPVLALQTHAGKLSKSAAAGTDQSIAVQELSMKAPPGDRSGAAQRIAELSGTHLSLDSSTFLPTSLSFNTHPDEDAGLDIPIVVRYADYRTVNGVRFPFHIQRYLNNGLVLDLQVESADVLR
jgi:hypothetical protein